MHRKKLVIRLLSEAIEKCDGIVDKLTNRLQYERWDGPSSSWYEPPDEPEPPDECPNCKGELDYSKDSLPCIGTPCGWVDTNTDSEITECPECEGELEVGTLQSGEDAIICKGKGCGWDCEPDGDPGV